MCLVSKTPENVPGAEVGFFWFGEEEKNVTALNITHGAMAVSYGSENPERALMVYDLYFYAMAALLGISITVSGVHEESLQGDVEFVHILEKMVS